MIRKCWRRKDLRISPVIVFDELFRVTQESMLNPADMPNWVKAALESEPSARYRLGVGASGMMEVWEDETKFTVSWGHYLVHLRSGRIQVWSPRTFDKRWMTVEVETE